MSYPITSLTLPVGMTFQKMIDLKRDANFILKVEHALDLAATAIIEEAKNGTIPEKESDIIRLARDVVRGDIPRSAIAKKAVSTGLSKGAFVYEESIDEITDQDILNFILVLINDLELISASKL